MSLRRREVAAALGLWVSPQALVAAAPDPRGLDAPNEVRLSAQLTCSGQPSRQGLQRLRALGFDAVIYLAPFSVGDAIADEPALVRAQGLDFAHVPMVWEAPTLAQVDAVLAQLARWQGRSVLMHCQVNLRASSLGFLWRVLRQQEDPAIAWAAVQAVWSPNRTWMRLIREALARGGVAFEPL